MTVSNINTAAAAVAPPTTIVASTDKNSNNQGADSNRWEEAKKTRNRLNSQRTRNNEQAYIKSLEAERCSLWLSNDALKFQNQHYRDMIARIVHEAEVRDNMNRNNNGKVADSSNSNSNSMNEDNDVLQIQNTTSAAIPNYIALSDPDLLARHQALQNMIRQQAAIGGNTNGTIE
mmetsp:Transcript_41554/g.45102  ORF Transcript_41554/g.45102 Transcript_41554/m.45102 type:complete len:175 (-) Transcript_41554:85-609(-)